MAMLSFVIAYLLCVVYFVTEYSLYMEYRSRAINIIPVLNESFQLAGSLFVTINAERLLLHVN